MATNKKINVTMSSDLIEELELMASKQFLSKSAFISFAVQQYLMQLKLTYAVKDFSVAVQRLSRGKVLTAEENSTIQNFDYLLDLLTERRG